MLNRFRFRKWLIFNEVIIFLKPIFSSPLIGCFGTSSWWRRIDDLNSLFVGEFRWVLIGLGNWIVTTAIDFWWGLYYLMMIIVFAFLNLVDESSYIYIRISHSCNLAWFAICNLSRSCIFCAIMLKGPAHIYTSQSCLLTWKISDSTIINILISEGNFTIFIIRNKLLLIHDIFSKFILSLCFMLLILNFIYNNIFFRPSCDFLRKLVCIFIKVITIDSAINDVLYFFRYHLVLNFVGKCKL